MRLKSSQNIPANFADIVLAVHHLLVVFATKAQIKSTNYSASFCAYKKRKFAKSLLNLCYTLQPYQMVGLIILKDGLWKLHKNFNTA